MAEYEKKVRDLLKQHGCYLVRRGKGDGSIDTFMLSVEPSP